VLAVAVELGGEVEVFAEGEAEAGLDGAADPEVAAEEEDARATGAGDGGGAIERAVVHDEGLEGDAEVGGGDGLELGEQTTERFLLVERRNDDEEAHGYTLRRAISRSGGSGSTRVGTPRRAWPCLLRHAAEGADPRGVGTPRRV
jgi:hypothetical protein